MLPLIPHLQDDKEDVSCWVIIYKYFDRSDNQLYYWENLCFNKGDTSLFEADFSKIVDKTCYKMYFQSQ